MQSGNLNFLEPSGPLQAWNGTALPLPLLNTSTYLLTYNRGLYHHNELNLLKRQTTLMQSFPEQFGNVQDALEKETWFLAAIYNTGLPIILYI
jgi:hypothetical protein